MSDTEATTVTDRARAAWRERQQEMLAKAAQAKAERELALVMEGTAAVVSLLDNDFAWPYASDETKEAAARLGIAVGSVTIGETGLGTVEFSLDDGEIWLLYTRPSGERGRLTLFTVCGVCGARVEHGYSLRNVSDLGAAIADRDEKPIQLHRCPEPEPEWEGELTLATAMSKSDDPALTLLDAIQSYVHAVVVGAVMCPATGGPHEYQRDSDDVNGPYIACVECKASPPKLPANAVIDDEEPF